MKTTKGYLSNNDTRICVLDGTICKSINDFYDTISFQLNFPNYFGRNLDALEEILYDLEWIEEANVSFILINEIAFLSEDFDLKQIVLDILSNPEIENIQLTKVN